MEIHIVQPWKPPQSFWKIKFDPQSRSQKLRFFSAIHRDFFFGSFYGGLGSVLKPLQLLGAFLYSLDRSGGYCALVGMLSAT